MITDTTGPRQRASRWTALALVLIALSFAACVRIRLAAVPLERDEGEYAYAGQLILDGVPPYRLAYNMKFPGTYYAYAAILAVFGESARGIHLGLLVVHAASVLLLFALGRRLVGDLAAGVAAAAFALLALDRSVMGVFAHATHFVVLPVLAGLLVIDRAATSGSRLGLLAGGALLGAAVLAKQHAVFYLPLGLGFAMLRTSEPARFASHQAAARAGLVALGVSLPLAAIVTLFAAQGVLDRFWFWTVRYAAVYVTQFPIAYAGQQLLRAFAELTGQTPWLWLAGGAGLAALWIGPWTPRARILLTGLAAVSFLAVCPGFQFRQHYFIVLLPALALFVGVAIATLDRALFRHAGPRAGRALALAAFAVLAASYVVREREYLFAMSTRELSRVRYLSNPFLESEEIARYIHERTSPSDRIAVLGSEPQIYFYARRRSATGYLYAYPLMEAQEFASTMQDEMIREIESAAPKYLVFVTIFTSWLNGPHSDQKLFDWINRYTETCYERVGIADIGSSDRPEILWDGAAASYRPESTNLVFTFQRRENGCPAPAGP